MTGIVRVVLWNDDLDDWPVGQRWAREVYFHHLAPDSDPRLGGAINTNQTHVIYAESAIKGALEAAYGENPKVVVRDWADFDPRRANPMHGLWVADAAHAGHQKQQAVHGWRTWTEGLDPAELDAQGRVRVQRAVGRYEAAKGTRTYYHNAVALSIPVYAANYENELGLAEAGAANQTTSVSHQGAFAWAAATPVGEPASAAWPTSGTYRCQIDCVAAGVDLTFGLLNQGGYMGGFTRLSGALDTELQLIAQSQSAFSGSGLHLASITNPAWTAGASSDHFAIKIAATRPIGHGSQTMTLQLGEMDDFVDGPWFAGAPMRNAVFFGTHF